MNHKFDYEEKIWGSTEMGLNPSYLGAQRLEICLKALELLPKGAKLLDAGCGAGAFCRAIKRYRPDLQISGCDISNKTISLAKQLNTKINYFKADISKIPQNIGRFDGVVSFDMFEHVEKVDSAFKSINGVLKKGGIFHFYVPMEGNFLSPYRWIPGLHQTKRLYTGHIQKFSINQINYLLNKHGFKLLKKTHSEYLIYMFADVSYVMFLKFSGKKINTAIEAYLAANKQQTKVKLLAILKNLFSRITYLESKMFARIPGMGMHVTAIKI